MAQMLTLLDVDSGMRVLEIGTGTGFNAALLCHRLGDANVTSIDIDTMLVETARARLAGLGHRPFLATGDGALGVPVRAPYSRIIATAAVATIPPAWISQLVHGGRIVADVRGELASALLVADKTTPSSVRGRFHDTPGHFMWLRSRADHPLRDGTDPDTSFDFTQPTQTTSDIPTDAFPTSASCGSCCNWPCPVSARSARTCQMAARASSCTPRPTARGCSTGPEPTRPPSPTGGPRALWPAIEDAWQRWNRWQLPEHLAASE